MCIFITVHKNMPHIVLTNKHMTEMTHNKQTNKQTHLGLGLPLRDWRIF